MTLDNIKSENSSTLLKNRVLTSSQSIMEEQLFANVATNREKDDKNDTIISFLRAARSGDLEKILEYIQTGEISDINASNANGLNALHLAAKDGYTDIVTELLTRGIAVDNSTKKGNTALHIASLAGQKEVIKLLIQYNANVNVQSLNGFTPLYMAAQENHDACVRYLLLKGANPSLATEDGFTPLAVAMQQGHDKVVSVLLESDVRGKNRKVLPALHIAAKKNDLNATLTLLQNGSNADTVSKSGFTPLHIAAHYGNVDVAKLLIEHGADVNFMAKHNITPLHVACKWGKKNILQLLLSQKAKIDATTRDGLTPLHCAARSGHVEMIELLLINKAPILSKTKNGLAALHMAAQGEHDEAAQLLLTQGAPVDEITVDYLTALHVAAHCGHVRVAKLLLDSNADPNARALNGFTPLHIACKKNRIKVVELLLKHGGNFNATTESGLTPLHVASFMGCMNIVIYLLQHKCNPDAATVRGETPLHLAARANQTDVIRILLRNGSKIDSVAREGQTPLHVASRLGNLDIIMLMIQYNASIEARTEDGYTPLHIAAKEGQEDVCQMLIENNAKLEAVTKKGFTPLHLASKYGRDKEATILLQKNINIDCQGKNDVTPLHVATHYNHPKVVALLLDKGASPKMCAKNGHSPLHIAAKKNLIEIAKQLINHGADINLCSKAGYSPLHLATQEGHVELSNILLKQKVDPNLTAKNGLTALHLAAQNDKTEIAHILLESGADISKRTKTGYTPLHIAAHYGQINMVKLLLENDANIEMNTNVGYTPLHYAAQQGHIMVINLLLRYRADPNAISNDGQTPLNIAHNLGYVTAVETLKVVTETSVTNATTGSLNEKYKVVSPELMHELFISDSEDEGCDESLDHQQYKYMANDDLKINKDHDHPNFNTTTFETDKTDITNRLQNEQALLKSDFPNLMFVPFTGNDTNAIKSTGNQNNNVVINRPLLHFGFLVSFLVDARGGSMRGCRHSGLRIVVPPKACVQPTRITCRYIKLQRVHNPPPLMEGEAIVSRILELSPVDVKFLSPIVLEVPHFGSLRGKEREIIILRSDNGENWREHTIYDNDSGKIELFNDLLEPVDPLEDLHTKRIVRIVTRTLPNFFAVVSRIRQEIHAIGPDGGNIYSSAVPLVQAIFPSQALTKKIRVGLQAQSVDLNNSSKILGQGVAVSPVVTVEPRRRKFHKAITLNIPAPKAYSQNMVNSRYASGNTTTLRLLCSITGGQNRAVWEDVTGTTPLTFVKDSVSFTTTVSARFWLMDCRTTTDASHMATKLFTYMIKVPFVVRFVVFAKCISKTEAKLSVFCLTDDKEDKTLEQQEYFQEIAKSREIEVLQNQDIYLEFAGNLIPILKSDEQLHLNFQAFRENRLSFLVHVKDFEEPKAKICFLNEPKAAIGKLTQKPFCALNISLLEQNFFDDAEQKTKNLTVDTCSNIKNLINTVTDKVSGSEFQIYDNMPGEDVHIIDICSLLGNDWVNLAKELGISEANIDQIQTEYKINQAEKSEIILRLWLSQQSDVDTIQVLENALSKIGRTDIVEKCFIIHKLPTNPVRDYRLSSSHTEILQYTQDVEPDIQINNFSTNGQ